LGQSSESGRLLRAVVLCALKVERLAMRAHLTDLQKEPQQPGFRFDIGRVKGGTSEIVLVEAGRGNVRAGAVTQQVISLFHPDILLCVGVAGALHDDLALADVVVATQVYAYQGGTATKEFLARPQAWPASHELEQLARSVDDSHDWWPAVGDQGREHRPRIHFRPIAAGDVVLDGHDSAMFEQLRLHYNDAAAIDMEDAGIAQVAHLNNVPALAIRGLSDHADGRKTDSDQAGWQQRAATAAATFAAALLARLDPAGRAAGISLTATVRSEERGTPDAANRQPRVPQLAYIREKTSGFVGRDSVFADLTTFLSTRPSGHIVVEGMPGMGKTSLLAEEVRRRNWPAHFNIAAQGITSALAFMRSLHGQLAERYQIQLASPGAGDEDDGQYIGSLLEETADRLSPNEQLVIVVDALDEASMTQTGANTLFLPTVLPAGLYLLVSRRRRTAELQIDGARLVIDLTDRQAEGRKDMERFIRESLARPAIEARLSGVTDQDRVVADLLDRSELNFMYLVYVLRDIEAGRMPPDDVFGLPQGLSGYYERHLAKMLSKGTSAIASLRTIYALAAIREPVPASLLASAVRVTELTVTTLLLDWEQFLLKDSGEGKTTYSLYHQSFRDFLMAVETVRAAGIDMGELNSAVGQGFIDRLGLDLEDEDEDEE
jgi:nucleoside phosphorylase